MRSAPSSPFVDTPSNDHCLECGHLQAAVNVAALAMVFADGRAAIGTGSERLAHEYLATQTSANAHSRQKILNRVGDNSVYRTIEAYLGHKDIRHTEQYQLGGNRDSVHSSKHL
jgi:hypothetical protein